MKFPCPLTLALLLAACAPATPDATPSDPPTGAYCSLDGMLLGDYPGPKGQIRYADGKLDWFCDTVELLSIYLAPEQARKVRGAYTQDMAQADWDTPHGHWIPVERAFYVHGSRRLGSMGPTLASFATRADAEAFARQYGGRVLAFAEITPQLVDLHGGATNAPGM